MIEKEKIRDPFLGFSFWFVYMEVKGKIKSKEEDGIEGQKWRQIKRGKGKQEPGNAVRQLPCHEAKAFITGEEKGTYYYS